MLAQARHGVLELALDRVVVGERDGGFLAVGPHEHGRSGRLRGSSGWAGRSGQTSGKQRAQHEQPTRIHSDPEHTMLACMSRSLTDVLGFLAQLAPLDLAEDWDNVGLLVEPSHASTRAIER